LGAKSFALRVRDGGQERALFARKELHVGIRRGWSAGSRILFVAKRVPASALAANGAGDSLSSFFVVIGAGTLEQVVELGDLADGEERARCLENNWYGKMLFASVARFVPAVPVAEAPPLAAAVPALLHGLEVDDASKVEALARAKIVT
jgi:hypothetical protein